MRITISIVEDDAGVRAGLVRLIEKSAEARCVSQHPTAENAIREIPQHRPDVVLMDINLPGLNGIECVRRIKALLPDTQIIMLTVYNKIENIFDALSAGATGYMLKHSLPDELLKAVVDVHAGGSPMNSSIARKIVQSFQKPVTAAHQEARLSPRESEILDLLAKGFLYKEIASKTGVTFATVHTHIRHIYEKLHVRSRTEAVAKHLSQAHALQKS